MLLYALHGYRTFIWTSTRVPPTHWCMVWKRSPVEVEIPSLRVLIERLTALCHGQLYQRRIKRAFDKKACPHTFREGDLVLKKILPTSRDQRGKWTLNYEGPYVRSPDPNQLGRTRLETSHQCGLNEKVLPLKTRARRGQKLPSQCLTKGSVRKAGTRNDVILPLGIYGIRSECHTENPCKPINRTPKKEQLYKILKSIKQSILYYASTKTKKKKRMQQKRGGAEKVEEMIASAPFPISGRCTREQADVNFYERSPSTLPLYRKTEMWKQLWDENRGSQCQCINRGDLFEDP
ncbi:hypothetical protein CR513_29646, partial [Mucuna pruriens]